MNKLHFTNNNSEYKRTPEEYGTQPQKEAELKIRLIAYHTKINNNARTATALTTYKIYLVGTTSFSFLLVIVSHNLLS
jgi:hypothetical protein